MTKLWYHHGMSIPYELNGRIGQKRRTRDALVAAARALVAKGTTPTVEEAAEAASISRTTAYRYFPNQRALLGGGPPGDRRLVAAARGRTRRRGDSARPRHGRVHSLDRRERGATAHDASTLTRSRSGRARAAAAAARAARSSGSRKRSRRSATQMSEAEVHRLTLAIRSATGIEAFVWLIDVAGLSRDDAIELMQWSARALLQSAIADKASNASARRARSTRDGARTRSRR